MPQEKIRVATFVAEQTDNSERTEVRVYEDLNMRNSGQEFNVIRTDAEGTMQTLSGQQLVFCCATLDIALQFAMEEVCIHLQ